MDNLFYLIIIIILSIFIMFFGGHNNQELIEYESNYFSNFNSIILLEKKINSLCKMNFDKIFLNNNFFNINSFLNTFNLLLPNFVNCFLIKISSFNAFNIFNIIDKHDYNRHIMIIFNHYHYNNLELIIESKNDRFKLNDNNVYFYNLKKKISIVGIYHIYNNSNENVIITCFILKKPFWFN